LYRVPLNASYLPVVRGVSTDLGRETKSWPVPRRHVTTQVTFVLEYIVDPTFSIYTHTHTHTHTLTRRGDGGAQRRDERDLHEIRRDQASYLSRSPFFHSRVSPLLHLAIIGNNNSLHSRTKPFSKIKAH
jgi:hypothetical protein